MLILQSVSCDLTDPIKKFLVYKKMEDAMKKHHSADVLVNFASLRSAFDSTLEALSYPQVIAFQQQKCCVL